MTLCIAFRGQTAHDDVIVARLELDVWIFAIHSLLDGFRCIGGRCGLFFGNLLNDGLDRLLLWNRDLNGFGRGTLCRLGDLLLLGKFPLYIFKRWTQFVTEQIPRHTKSCQ